MVVLQLVLLSTSINQYKSRAFTLLYNISSKITPLLSYLLTFKQIIYAIIGRCFHGTFFPGIFISYSKEFDDMGFIRNGEIIATGFKWAEGPVYNQNKNSVSGTEVKFQKIFCYFQTLLGIRYTDIKMGRHLC